MPEAISGARICRDERAGRSSPALSSVQIPAEDVGRQAVELLMRKLDDRAVPPTTLLPPILTRRASTASAAT